MFYKWLTKAAGSLAAIIGLLFVAFLPPIVVLAAEVRQYALLLAFLASALYFLDEAFAKNSRSRMAVFSPVSYTHLDVYKRQFRALKTHLRQFVAKRLVGFFKRLPRDRELPGEILALSLIHI